MLHRAAHFVFFMTAITGSAVAQIIPDLRGVDTETRQLIENACVGQKFHGGPAGYGGCLKKHLEAARAAPPIPRLNGLDSQTRQLIENACVGQKFHGGPVGYGNCLRKHIASAQSSAPIPSLQGVDPQTRQLIENACVGPKFHGGPEGYGNCLRRHLSSIGHPAARSQSSSAAGAPASPSQGIPTEQRTDSTVRRVQERLKSLGYDPGMPDGRLGSRTRQAIEKFQKDRGLPVNGEINTVLQTELDRRVRVQPVEVSIYDLDPIPFKWPTWRRVQASRGQPISNTIQDPANIYGRVNESVWVVLAGRSEKHFKDRKDLSQGSAVAVSDRFLLTNCHVVRDRALIVIGQGDDVRSAILSSAHPDTDRCILEVEDASRSLVPVPGIRRFRDLKIGERVYSIGAPRGLERTLGEGIVSGLRTTKFGNLVQTSAPISPGSSGGGLFDAFGNLIGLTTFLLRESQAINFAIAAEEYWK